MSSRRHLLPADFSTTVQSVFESARVLEIKRLQGGSKKGVYRLLLGDQSPVVAYVWSDDEDYWSHVDPSSPDDPFAHASGVQLFASSHATLTKLGVRVPRLLLLTESSEMGPVALLEDVAGGSLEAALGTPRSTAALEGVREMLHRMHAHRSSVYGKVAGIGTAASSSTPLAICLARAEQDLSFAAERIPKLAAAAMAVSDRLRTLHQDAPPADDYGLIHGELGPDHVLLDERGEPVLIDIEGVMFFDVEWEHTFLELRFGKHYSRLRSDDLDDARLRFYRLCLYLSLVAGPLRLLDGDFPDREPMLRIVDANVARVLDFVS